MLVEEGVLSAIKKPKHNYKLRDLERTIRNLWTNDDPFFMTGRYRVQFHFITLQFLCTGGRISSLTPSSLEKVGRGLRYKVRAVTGIYFIAQMLTLVRILNLYYFVMSMTLGKLDGGLTSSSLKIIKTLRIQCMQLYISLLPLWIVSAFGY